MASPEDTERARQAIMRFRELLDILTGELADAERHYAELFSSRSPEEMETLPHKELQRLAALDLLDERSRLGDAALHMRFVCRNLERDFEQVYDNIMVSE